MRANKLIALMASVAIFAMGCSKKAEVELKTVSDIHSEKGIPVKTVSMEPQEIENWTTYNSDVEGFQHVEVFGLLHDNIKKVNVKIGDIVKEGQIVAEYAIDSPTAQFQQAKLSLENSKKMYDRMKEVYAGGGISQQDLDNLETQYKVALENYNSMAQMVKVEAPISGKVTEVSVDNGDLVSPATAICKIATTSTLKTSIQVDEEEIFNYKVNDPAHITWSALPNKTFNGKVSKVSMSANPELRSFTVEISIENNQDLLKPGAFVDIKVRTFKSEPTLSLDRLSILEEDNKSYVYVLDQNEARKQTVKTGRDINGIVEIIAGLHEGDEVISEGLTLIEDGSKVNVVEKIFTKNKNLSPKQIM
jgi:RND family efflux transporter MFP subunit